ncbi:hypothetical protein [Lysobacter sp. F6437]|uniref:hypothetical protein n=1 Tax=Lysobacter sp. F6437 TaxID=3459296 RepID=UPI00403DD049
MPFDVMAAVKWIAGLALACLLTVGGCSYGVNRERSAHADALRKSSEAMITARDQLRGCATSLNFANDQALRNQELAEQEAERADAEVKQALKDAIAYARRLGELEGEIEAAKADPDCRRVLESTTCSVLR